MPGDLVIWKPLLFEELYPLLPVNVYPLLFGKLSIVCGKPSIALCTSFSGPPWARQAGGTGIRFADHFGEIPSCFLAKINQALGSSGLSDGQCVCVR